MKFTQLTEVVIQYKLNFTSQKLIYLQTCNIISLQIIKVNSLCSAHWYYLPQHCEIFGGLLSLACNLLLNEPELHIGLLVNRGLRYGLSRTGLWISPVGYCDVGLTIQYFLYTLWRWKYNCIAVGVIYFPCVRKNRQNWHGEGSIRVKRWDEDMYRYNILQKML